MTLTPEQLRDAAERAGLTLSSIVEGKWFACRAGTAWVWHNDDPALPAYIAELLRAKVLRNEDTWNVFRHYMKKTHGTLTLGASPAEVIRASMRALTGNQEWGG